MSRTVLTLALAALLGSTATAQAGVHIDKGCEIDSDFDLRFNADRIELEREQGSPRTVSLGGGRLWLDGAEQTLSPADAQRIAAIEAQARALLPEVRDIALEGVGMAVEAVSQVASLLGGEQAEQAKARAQELQARLAERVDRQFEQGVWNDDEFEREIEGMVGELVPEIAGEIAAVAVKAALSGDEEAAREIERRAEQLDQTLEREMEQRAKALEARAEALCPRIRALDEIESELELRLPDGGRLDLVQL